MHAQQITAYDAGYRTCATLLMKELPGSTSDTNRIFRENYSMGVKILNDLIRFATKEYNPHNYQGEDEKLDSLIGRLPISKMYLEKAYICNKKDKNTLIGLLNVSNLVRDTVSFIKYADVYSSLK